MHITNCKHLLFERGHTSSATYCDFRMKTQRDALLMRKFRLSSCMNSDSSEFEKPSENISTKYNHVRFRLGTLEFLQELRFPPARPLEFTPRVRREWIKQWFRLRWVYTLWVSFLLRRGSGIISSVPFYCHPYATVLLMSTACRNTSMIGICFSVICQEMTCLCFSCICTTITLISGMIFPSFQRARLLSFSVSELILILASIQRRMTTSYNSTVIAARENLKAFHNAFTVFA